MTSIITPSSAGRDRDFGGSTTQPTGRPGEVAVTRTSVSRACRPPSSHGPGEGGSERADQGARQECDASTTRGGVDDPARVEAYGALQTKQEQKQSQGLRAPLGPGDREPYPAEQQSYSELEPFLEVDRRVAHKALQRTNPADVPFRLVKEGRPGAARASQRGRRRGG